MKKPVSIAIIPEGSTPEEIFQRIVTDHATSNGITPDRIEWQGITSPETGVFLVPIKDAEGPMRIVALLTQKERSASSEKTPHM